MTLIVKPFTFTAGTKAKASEVNSDFDTAYTCLNGAIGEANVTYVTASDGLRVARAGPNAGGTNGTRFAIASTTIAMAGAASGTATVTFSTDCVKGNPAFSAAPTLAGIAIFSNTVAPDPDIPIVWVQAISSTQLTLKWDRTYLGALNVQSITVTIGLLGDV